VDDFNYYYIRLLELQKEIDKLKQINVHKTNEINVLVKLFKEL